MRGDHRRGPRGRLGSGLPASWSSSSARAWPEPAPARGPCACPTSGPGSRRAAVKRTAPFTARPASRQITLARPRPTSTSTPSVARALHDEHLALGATMDRFGGWWRPWHYGDHLAEYRAVREAVSLGDVSTLGKFIVAGPDAVEFLQRLYPTDVSTIRPGRSRYALLLNERGPRHRRRDDLPRDRGPIRPDLHHRRCRQRRDVDARLARDVGPPRPPHGPHDVAGRHQRHRPARRRAPGAPGPGRSAAVPPARADASSPACRSTSCG